MISSAAMAVTRQTRDKCSTLATAMAGISITLLKATRTTNEPRGEVDALPADGIVVEKVEGHVEEKREQHDRGRAMGPRRAAAEATVTLSSRPVN